MKIVVHVRQSRDAASIQAYCPDLPGCSASAPTEAEALAVLRRRISEHFTRGARPAPGARTLTLEV